MTLRSYILAKADWIYGAFVLLVVGSLLWATAAIGGQFNTNTVTICPLIVTPTNYSVLLAWDASTDSIVTSYNVYAGTNSGVYVQKVHTTNTTCTVSNLLFWVTNYFAATTQSAAGIESVFSREISFEEDGFSRCVGVIVRMGATNAVLYQAAEPLGPWFATATNQTAVTNYFTPLVNQQFYRAKSL